MYAPQPYTPPVIPTVVYDADGRPLYAFPQTPAAAPLAPYQPPAQPAMVYQPAPLPAQPMMSAQHGYSALRDPIAARLLAGGIGAGAAGVGLGFLFSALAAATTALGLLLGILALIWLVANTGGSRGGGAVRVTVNNRMTNRNR
jgi:hypothetical protein